MTTPNSPFEIAESERTPLVEWLLNIIAQQQQVIEQQQETIGKLEAKVTQLEEKVGNLEEQLKASKKLKGKPKIQPSKLNEAAEQTDKSGKRAGSDKRSKKTSLVVDEERVIEPEEALLNEVWIKQRQGLIGTSSNEVVSE